jgi:hypothetical protein
MPILDTAKLSPGSVPCSWITGNEITSLFDEISLCETEQNKFFKRRDELKIQYQNIYTNDNSINKLEAELLTTTADIEAAGAYVKSFMSTFPYSKWDLEDEHLSLLFEEAQKKSASLNYWYAEILSQFEEEIFDIDFKSIENRYKTDYTSIFKVFKKSYRDDKRAIRVNYKTSVRKVTDEMVLDIIKKLHQVSMLKKWFSRNQSKLQNYFGDLYNAEKTDFTLIRSRLDAFEALNNASYLLNEMQEITEALDHQEAKLTSHYQFLYKGINTKWEDIRTALTWAVNFREQVKINNVNHSFIENICSMPKTAKKCARYAKEIKSIMDEVENDSELQWFLSLFTLSEAEAIKRLEMPTLQARLERCKNTPSLLDEWIAFRDARENCRKGGLADYVSKMDELQINKDDIVPIFKKRFFHLWLDAVLPQHPAVLNFKRHTHEATIDEFAKLDKSQFAIAKSVIKDKLINKLPQINHCTNGTAEVRILLKEVRILKSEMSKKRNKMPVRRLFREIVSSISKCEFLRT